MTKEEFISFLKEKAEHHGIGCTHWKQTYENTEDFWHLYKPFVDWVEDTMNLTEDGVVLITYNQSLYENISKEFRTTYEDFIQNYNKTISR